MIGERTTMSVRNEVLRLHATGMGKKKIARALMTSPTTVRGIITESKGGPLIGPEPATAVFAGTPWCDSIPWDNVARDLKKPYATIKNGTLFSSLLTGVASLA